MSALKKMAYYTALASNNKEKIAQSLYFDKNKISIVILAKPHWSFGQHQHKSAVKHSRWFEVAAVCLRSSFIS